ncbi:MAG TPA: hypothetical protein VMH28_07870 [Candidatus Acidoferrales bacterium]|nr:hypothetical protein [Candidatus Acidoferrales bacterium]
MLKPYLIAGVCAAAALAQDMTHMHMNRAEMYLMNMSSGTSMNPYSWRMPMLMTETGNWTLMFMGQAFVVDTQQGGPRGGDKLYSPNWFMGAAEHALGGGAIMFTAMLSLEPATVTNRSYPLLLQTGETAYGRPLVDAQHPHDLFMALSVQYAHRWGRDTMLQFYYAPVGDPALGPVAYPHRASAMELPQAPIGHHWQDSTHIADDVATVALRHKWLRVEASGFYGTEPDENRWNFDWGPINSYSARVSLAPAQNWMAQVSAGRLTRPERQEPGDVTRMTASLHYTRGGWSSSFIWGRNQQQLDHRDLDSFLGETVVPVGRPNLFTGRLEVVDKDELAVPGTYRVQAYTGGYTRDLGSFQHIQAGIGANATAYAIPAGLKPAYGDHPWSVNVYLRLRLK